MYMINPFRKRSKTMALSNKPQDDAKVMIDEYQKGATIDDIALKYNHTTEEVEGIVTKPVTDEQPVTQAELDDNQPAVKPSVPSVQSTLATPVTDKNGK